MNSFSVRNTPSATVRGRSTLTGPTRSSTSVSIRGNSVNEARRAITHPPTTSHFFPRESDAWTTTSTNYARTPSRHSASRTTTRSRSLTRSRATRSSIGGTTERHDIVCAVSEARGVSPSVGMAIVNITTGEAVLSQICDTQFYVKTIHKINMFEPSRILIVSTSAPPNQKSNLFARLESDCLMRGMPLVPLARKYWSESAGLDLIKMLAFREDVEAIKVAIEGNFFATCAFSAAMKYLESEFSVRFASHSLRIKYQPSQDTMMIDISTITSLELIQNLQNVKSKACLFGLLNQAQTPMGSRMIRSSILQPSTRIDDVIHPRFDAVSELSTREDMFQEIRKSLEGFFDVEKLLTTLIILPTTTTIYESEQAINRVLMIKKFVVAIQPIFESLTTARSSLLARVRDLCRPENTAPLLELINKHINEDVTYAKAPIDLRNQKTYAVKAGVNGMLDVERKAYKEATEDLHKHVDGINAALDIAGNLRFDNKRKFYLRLRVADFEHREMPDEIINRVHKRDWIECQTLSLMQLNQRITNAADEVTRMSDETVRTLLDEIRVHVSHMFRVCEGIAVLDMLASFSYIVAAHDYVRPDMSGTLALKAARHPILEKPNPEAFVPNDYYAAEQHRFNIVTGCNMSGKSTYIRTIALLQVMAQIGCFVPAQYAVFPVVHNLFSRITTDDSIEENMSTFSMEMREMAFILRNVNERSLVIIDELGRGTATRDGLSIAISMAETLVQSGSMVFFATHFLELAQVFTDRPGVLNQHLETKITTRNTDDQEHAPDEEGREPLQMTMVYKIRPGPVREQNYGIYLARAVGFPREFIHRAEFVSNTLRDQLESERRQSQARKLAVRRRLILGLQETLQQASESRMGQEGDESVLAGYLSNIMAEFLRRMEDIESAGDPRRRVTGRLVDEPGEEDDNDDVSMMVCDEGDALFVSSTASASLQHAGDGYGDR